MNRPCSNIVLVGPTHPHTGGIAQHTTRLALELEKLDKNVVVESWKHQYPSFLYRGASRVPAGEPEIGVARRVVEKLTWFSPFSWWFSGYRSRNADVIAATVPTPIHAIPYLFLFLAAGKGPKRIGLIHNVLPHEDVLGARRLMKILLSRLDVALVHSQEAADLVQDISQGSARAVVKKLPSPWLAPESTTTPPVPTAGRLRILFFGTVRPYKGVDVLLSAVAQVENCELLIAGQFWEKQEIYDGLIEKLGIDERVSIRNGYVRSGDFSNLFSQADILVLPYKSASGSIVRELGFDFGLPVVTSDVGPLGEGIVSGQNGEIVPAGNISALAKAIEDLTRPEYLNKLRIGAKKLKADRTRLWVEYANAICT